MRYLFVRRYLIAFIGLMLFSIQSWALMVDMNTRTLIENSARSVVATVKAVETRQVPEYNNTLFTFITLETNEVISGSIGSVFTLRLFGGTSGDTVISSPIDFAYQPGQKLVMFLGEDNDSGFPLIFPQGIYTVQQTSVSDTQFVQRGADSAPHGGILFYRAGTESVYSSLPRSLPLADYVDSVRRAVFIDSSLETFEPLDPASNQ